MRDWIDPHPASIFFGANSKAGVDRFGPAVSVGAMQEGVVCDRHLINVESGVLDLRKQEDSP